MKKLSLKWKLFLIFCYLQVISYGLLIVLIIIQLFNSPLDKPEFVILFMIGFLLIFLNNGLCIYIVHRFFPDTLLPSKTRLWLNVLGIINLVLFLGLLIMYVSLLVLEFSDQHDESTKIKKTGLWLVGFFSALWILGVYTLILQFLVPGYLRRASHKKINSLIDSIGQD